MYCMPPNIGFPGTTYAYINSGMSIYNNNWCSSVSAQVHEVGHNLNVAHTGEGNDEYGDETGLMGIGYIADDTRACYKLRTCFNWDG